MKDDKSKSKSLECINSVKKDVEKYRKNFEKNWRDEEELYYGHCWKNQTQYRPYENKVFDLVETAVPMLTDSLPAPSVKIVDPEKSGQGETLKRAIEWVNADNDLPIMLPDVVRDTLITGNSYIFPYYDHDAKNGEGAEIYEHLNWNQVYFSGRSRKLEDCDKARIVLERSRDWLILKYPKFKEKLEKEKAKENLEQDSERGFENVDSGAGYARRVVPPKYTDDDTLQYVLTFKKDSSLESIPEQETLEEIQEALSLLAQGVSPDSNKYQDHKKFIEAYEQQLALLKVEVQLPAESSIEDFQAVIEQLASENPEAEQEFTDLLFQAQLIQDSIESHKVLIKLNPEGGRLKYPGGYRLLESVNSLVLYDGPNKFPHKEIPIVPFYCYRTKSIYAHGMIRNVADSQRMAAVLQFKEYKGQQLVTNPAKEVNLEAGVNKDDITNEDGAIYEVKAGQQWAVRNIQPGQVSEQVRRFSIDRHEAMKEISGMTDPTRGELPDGRLSELTVHKTQVQALGRVRLKDRQNQYYSLRRLAKLVAYDIIENWETEKILDLEESDGEFTQVIFNPIEFKDLEFDIVADTSSMTGVDKDQFNQFLTGLLTQDKITFEQYTELADLPKIERLKEFAAQNSQVQAQMQEMQAQLEQLQQENIKLKGELDTELLNPQEGQAFDEIQRREALSQLGGVNQDQPPIP